MISLDQKNHLLAFVVTLIAVLFFSHWNLLYFAPLLIIIYYQKSYVTCLWYSLLCGLFLDLLSAQSRLGFGALNYCLTTAILFPQKRNFFADRLSTLPLMTFFFAVLTTLIQWCLMYIFEKQVIFSIKWCFTDLLAMPCADALYAFSVFIIPGMIFRRSPKRGKDYFLRN